MKLQSRSITVANKVFDTWKGSRVYWSLLKSFLNNQKISLIPLLFNENCFIVDFKIKADCLQSVCMNHCFLIENPSKLPANLIFLTHNLLFTASFSHKDTAEIYLNSISGSLLGLLSNFRVIGNNLFLTSKDLLGKMSAQVFSRIHFGTISDLFIIYLKDLLWDLTSKGIELLSYCIVKWFSCYFLKVNLFADETSLSSVTHDINISANKLTI